MEQQEKIETTNENEKKNFSIHQLWWLNEQTRKSQHAGVAYYNEEQGDYYLYLSYLPHDKRYRYTLRPFETLNDVTLYRVERTEKVANKNVVRRKKVGDAISSKKTNGDIYIDLGPHSKILVLPRTNE